MFLQIGNGKINFHLLITSYQHFFDYLLALDQKIKTLAPVKELQ